MDWLTFIRNILTPAQPTPAAGAPMEMNQRDLDLRDPATGQLTPGGVPVVPTQINTPSAQGGLSGRVDPQKALQQGDPKLIELLRARQTGGAVPATTQRAPAGYGAMPRQNSFGDGTGSNPP